MKADAHFSSESDSAEVNRRTTGAETPRRALMLLVSVVVGVVLIGVTYRMRAVPENVALGTATTNSPGSFGDLRINAWRIPDYASVYKPESELPLEHEWLWLGNSQLHSINQIKPDEHVAPVIAGKIMNFPVFGLSLPNASLQEHLAVAHWALTRRTPDWLIVGVVYDDLRETDLRPEFADLLSPEWEASMSAGAGGKATDAKTSDAGPVAPILLEQARAAMAKTKQDMQGTTREHSHSWHAISLQEITEARLDAALGMVLPPWRERENIYVGLMLKLYVLRNRVFDINAQTKRPMIAFRYQRNMDSLKELLALAASKKIPTLMYIVPLRRDIDPPYFMDQYEAWKKDVTALAASQGAHTLDLDMLVPAQLWGHVGDGDVDFMHFQGPGHELLAKAVTDEIRRIESDSHGSRPTSPATPPDPVPHTPTSPSPAPTAPGR